MPGSLLPGSRIVGADEPIMLDEPVYMSQSAAGSRNIPDFINSINAIAPIYCCSETTSHSICICSDLSIQLVAVIFAQVSEYVLIHYTQPVDSYPAHLYV